MRCSGWRTGSSGGPSQQTSGELGVSAWGLRRIPHAHRHAAQPSERGVVRASAYTAVVHGASRNQTKVPILYLPQPTSLPRAETQTSSKSLHRRIKSRQARSGARGTKIRRSPLDASTGKPRAGMRPPTLEGDRPPQPLRETLCAP